MESGGGREAVGGAPEAGGGAGAGGDRSGNGGDKAAPPAESAPVGAGAAPGLSGISKAPVNVLFNMSSIAKRDVWEIDLIKILEMLTAMLEKSGRKDFKIAGMAALSSSLIYRMKVERIFALHREAMEKTPVVDRPEVDIAMIGMPYRHEPTRPVTLSELLSILEGLIDTIANPRRKRRRPIIETVEEPSFEESFVALENIIGKYEVLILSKLGEDGARGTGLLGAMTASLGDIDAIRCFFAALFLARDERVDLAQEGDDIRVTLIAGEEAGAAEGGGGGAAAAAWAGTGIRGHAGAPEGAAAPAAAAAAAPAGGQPAAAGPPNGRGRGGAGAEAAQ